MKYAYLIIFLILLSVGCKSSCDYAEAEIFFDYVLSFRLVDKNDESVIGAYRAKYSSDDVRIKTKEGVVLPETNITDGGTISLVPMISEDWSQLSGRDIERDFYLFLPDTSYDSGFDVDTIRLTFRAETCEVGAGCCGGFEYESFNISYNNKAPHHRDDTNDYYKFYLFRK